MERTVKISCFQRFTISITKLSTNMHPLKDCQIGKQSSCLNLGLPLELRHRLQLKVNCMHQVTTLGTNTIETKSVA